MQEWFEDFLKFLFKDKLPTKQQLKKLILGVSDCFTFSNFKRSLDYMKNADFLKGYIVYFVPVNLSKLYSILNELLRHPSIFNKKALKIVDIGCGPSPAVLPFFKLFLESMISSSYIRYIGIDSEEKAIEVARSLIDRFKPKNLSVNHEFLKADASDFNTYIELKELKPDIMIFSNSLGEIFDNKKITQEDFIRFIKYFTYQNENFTLIIIEPATKRSTMRMHILRDNLIEELRLYPYSPCVNNIPCPALKAKNWCYEERKWRAPQYFSFLSAIGLQVNYLKFSYIVLRKDRVNIRDTFSECEVVIKNTSHVINEKGKSRLWGCFNGKLFDIERLKRDYIDQDPWLNIKKGCYFSVDSYITFSDNKIRISKDASVDILYCP